MHIMVIYIYLHKHRLYRYVRLYISYTYIYIHGIIELLYVLKSLYAFFLIYLMRSFIVFVYRFMYLVDICTVCTSVSICMNLCISTFTFDVPT